MNRLVLISVFLFICTSSNYSQLVEENFDYPAGDSIGAHGWVNFSGGSVNRILVTSPGLSFPDYAGSGIGNSTELLNTGQDAYMPFASTQTSGNIYASMMVRIDTAKSGDFFAAFLTSTSTNNFFGRLYAKMSANGNVAFGISKTTAASGGIFYGDSIYTPGITYLLILKYTLAPGALNDSVSLFVFSTAAPSAEPSPTIGPITGTASDPADLARFALRQGTSSSSPNLHLDGILVSTYWDNSLLPVELSSFYSTASSGNIILNWSTNSETNNFGFDVERSYVTKTTAGWKRIGFVNGNGTTVNPHDYSFRDCALTSGRYKYRIRQIDFNGNFRYYEMENEAVIGIPDKVRLYQNYPNPFNPVTRINFDLPYSAEVTMTLVDISGKEIASIVRGNYEAGFHSADLDASSLSSGIYFCRLLTNGNGNVTLTANKLVVIK